MELGEWGCSLPDPSSADAPAHGARCSCSSDSPFRFIIAPRELHRPRAGARSDRGGRKQRTMIGRWPVFVDRTGNRGLDIVGAGLGRREARVAATGRQHGQRRTRVPSFLLLPALGVGMTRAVIPSCGRDSASRQSASWQRGRRHRAISPAIRMWRCFRTPDPDARTAATVRSQPFARVPEGSQRVTRTPRTRTRDT